MSAPYDARKRAQYSATDMVRLYNLKRIVREVASRQWLRTILALRVKSVRTLGALCSMRVSAQASSVMYNTLCAERESHSTARSVSAAGLPGHACASWDGVMVMGRAVRLGEFI